MDPDTVETYKHKKNEVKKYIQPSWPNKISQ